jgi:catechol 2,3-dioxygenase-like lactoylglutathione lyase family enzyme
MRLDHVVIGVRDLAAASETLRAAGFDVRYGGRHTGFGTENATIRFGLDYIELITVRDEAEAEASSPRSRELASFLRRYEAGLVGFALATDELDEVARRLRAVGQDTEGPSPMRRVRPDGLVLEWKLLIPGGVAWRRPWPFFISWALPDTERLAIERPGTHRVPMLGLAGISVAVEDLHRACAIYEAAVGAPVEWSATRLAFMVGDFRIDVVAPGDARAPVLDRGPGPFEVRLRTGPSDGPWKGAEVLPSVVFAFQ